MTTLSNYEALLALSTSPALTPVMREYLVKVLVEHREMRTALRSLMDMLDRGELVRDISKDGEDGFALRMMPFMQTLTKANAALFKAEAHE